MSTTTLPFEILIRLSHDEFDRYIKNNTNLSDKDMLFVITRFENDVLGAIKQKEGENSERYKFFNRVCRIMYSAMQAEENINFWKNIAIRCKMMEEFHAQNAAIYYNDLLRYKAVEEVIDSGKLDEYIANIKKRATT